ncbi:uncharacterized protein LOC6651353 [Drosophila willistoni]|nr:uncharacterized protein LOC6651353 [Drosophila willistoni]
MACPWLILCLCPIWMTNGGTIQNLLLDIKHQSDFHYMLMMENTNSSGNSSSWSRNLVLGELQLPVLQLDAKVSYFLHDKMSKNLISLVYLGGWKFEESLQLLNALVANLRHMTTSRVLFLISMELAKDETILYKLFSYCWKMKLLNALALLEDFETTNTLYGYTNFPTLQLEQRQYVHGSSMAIFPERLKNLHGFRLPIIVGGSTPRVIAYFNKLGQFVYEGAVGHFMDAFQRKYNCRFYQPLPAKGNAFAPSQETVAAVRNLTVEMSMALTFPTIPPFGYSYPYEQMNWCMMLPVEADVPTPEYYTRVFELQAFLLALATMIGISCLLASSLRLHGYPVYKYEFFLHDSCLRGVLGQSFCEVFRAPILVRGIYLQICVLGILITAWYNSYFSTYVTTAPKQMPYNSYDDVMAAHIKVLAWKPEYGELIGRLQQFRKYEHMFLVEPIFSRYLKFRDSFDTNFGYMMTSTKWVIVNEQQKVFTKPLFRLRNDFCFFNNIPFGFPVHENSIYMEPIMNLIMELDANGLPSHWRKMGFTELIKSGELAFVDLSPHREFRAMQLMDLQYIWYGFAFMAILSTSVWLMEIVWHRLKRRWQLKMLTKPL